MAAREHHWDVDKGEILLPDIPMDVVVHLAGENIAGGRWTRERKRKLRESRINGTRLLVEELKKGGRLPRRFLSASAVGIYQPVDGSSVAEDAPVAEGFLGGLASDWEAEAMALEGVPVACMRFGIVLGRGGGVLGKMELPFKLGLGGALGDGSQWMSWIALEDVVKAVLFLIAKPEITGAVNLTSPEPCTNSEFTKALSKALHRPAFIPVPAFFLRLVFGEMADAALLASSRVIPQRLMKEGFEFGHSRIVEALKSIYSD